MAFRWRRRQRLCWNGIEIVDDENQKRPLEKDDKITHSIYWSSALSRRVGLINGRLVHRDRNLRTAGEVLKLRKWTMN